MSDADRELIDRVRGKAVADGEGARTLAARLGVAKNTAASVLEGRYPTRMNAATRKALKAYLRGSVTGNVLRETPPEVAATTDAADLARQIEAVQAADMEEVVRAWQLAEIGAAWRALALAREASAAEARAKAAIAEAGAADGRARASIIAEEGARDRVKLTDAADVNDGTATAKRRRQQRAQRPTPAAQEKKPA